MTGVAKSMCIRSSKAIACYKKVWARGVQIGRRPRILEDNVERARGEFKRGLGEG